MRLGAPSPPSSAASLPIPLGPLPPSRGRGPWSSPGARGDSARLPERVRALTGNGPCWLPPVGAEGAPAGPPQGLSWPSEGRAGGGLATPRKRPDAIVPQPHTRHPQTSTRPPPAPPRSGETASSGGAKRRAHLLRGGGTVWGPPGSPLLCSRLWGLRRGVCFTGARLCPEPHLAPPEQPRGELRARREPQPSVRVSPTGRLETAPRDKAQVAAGSPEARGEQAPARAPRDPPAESPARREVELFGGAGLRTPRSFPLPKRRITQGCRPSVPAAASGGTSPRAGAGQTAKPDPQPAPPAPRPRHVRAGSPPPGVTRVASTQALGRAPLHPHPASLTWVSGPVPRGCTVHPRAFLQGGRGSGIGTPVRNTPDPTPPAATAHLLPPPAPRPGSQGSVGLAEAAVQQHSPVGTRPEHSLRPPLRPRCAPRPPGRPSRDGRQGPLPRAAASGAVSGEGAPGPAGARGGGGPTEPRERSESPTEEGKQRMERR
ncbi:basic proline-rich protein-like [Choloepus didactylus]|uniref:basic proline-rich protein-like n=1 Tax=Choloepus didactylus TaxID=27675 RepID=UPI00189E66D5|nr:basic proline-rich protein-like [Choloepus didactylus]